jgi:hypothetical protein
MRVSKVMAATLVMVGMMSAMMVAESKNPADYPLRLHIFGRSQTSFYYSRARSLDETQGDGRANLYENGEARGMDFNYRCDYKVRASFGYETYPARWKKQGKQLVVLLPVFGQAGKYFTCDFNADVKDFAYANGKEGLRSEPVAQFKLWMQRHDYDPEHGKDVPVRSNAAGEQSPMPPPENSGEGAPPPPPPPPPAPQR